MKIKTYTNRITQQLNSCHELKKGVVVDYSNQFRERSELDGEGRVLVLEIVNNPPFPTALTAIHIFIVILPQRIELPLSI